MKKYFMVLPVLFIFLLAGVGCEREGTIKTSDCREEIELKENDFATLARDFTCEYIKTEKGKLLSGTCYRVKIRDGECSTVWSYEKKAEVTCSKEYPWAGYDDNCYKEWDYGRVYIPE